MSECRKTLSVLLDLRVAGTCSVSNQGVPEWFPRNISSPVVGPRFAPVKNGFSLKVMEEAGEPLRANSNELCDSIV